MKTVRVCFLFLFFILCVACRRPAIGTDVFEDPVQDPDEHPVLPPHPPHTAPERTPIFDPTRFRMTEQDSTDPEETAEYANLVVFLADCEPDPVSVDILYQNDTEDACDNMALWSYREDDGDIYEWGTPTHWWVENPSILALDFPNGPSNEIAHPYGLRDATDFNGVEPETVVHACAINSCPVPRPDDCADEVCASVNVTSIVNVSGNWMLSSQMGEESIVLVQHGRNFESPDPTVKFGHIEGTSVTFHSGDYQYDGEITDHGHAMSGTVTDLILLQPAGSWFAVRP